MLSRRAAMIGALALAACAPAAGDTANQAQPGNAEESAGGARNQRIAVAGPLSGLWHQSSPVCAAGKPPPMPVTELEFDARGPGSFAVTFVPFETYQDYWGRYRFDPASGTLAMTVESGNSIPTDLDLEGIARIGPDGILAIEGMSFGTANGGGPERPGCPLRFRRD